MLLRTTRLAGVALLALSTGGACSMRDPPPPPPIPTPAKLEQDLLDHAFQDCFLGDCERAYAHLTELPPTSTLRQSIPFRAVQYRYDADRLLHADVELDLTKRRALLEAVAGSPTADPLLRVNANERLARLGGEGASREIALNAAPAAASPAATEAAEAEILLQKSQSKLPADQAEVRAKIEPKVFAGKATPADVAMLRNVCKSQRDMACLRQLDKLILR
jgi:hypothetical protein